MADPYSPDHLKESSLRKFTPYPNRTDEQVTTTNGSTRPLSTISAWQGFPNQNLPLNPGPAHSGRFHHYSPSHPSRSHNDRNPAGHHQQWQQLPHSFSTPLPPPYIGGSQQPYYRPPAPPAALAGTSTVKTTTPAEGPHDEPRVSLVNYGVYEIESGHAVGGRVDGEGTLLCLNRRTDKTSQHFCAVNADNGESWSFYSLSKQGHCIANAGGVHQICRLEQQSADSLEAQWELLPQPGSSFVVKKRGHDGNFWNFRGQAHAGATLLSSPITQNDTSVYFRFHRVGSELVDPKTIFFSKKEEVDSSRDSYLNNLVRVDALLKEQCLAVPVECEEQLTLLLGDFLIEKALLSDKGPKAFQSTVEIRKRMDVIVERVFGRDTSVRTFAFGSTVSCGIWNGSDDVDLTVVDPIGWISGSWPGDAPPQKGSKKKKKSAGAGTKEKAIISKLFNAMLKLNGEERIGYLEHVSHARVPIVRHKRIEHWDQEANSEECSHNILRRVDFDLSCRAHGVRNSYFLRMYLSQKEEFRIGSIVLKHWSKTSETVHNSRKGYLTSYAVTILWIYYLIQKGHCMHIDPDTVPELPSTADQSDLVYCPLVSPEVMGDPDRMKDLKVRVGALVLGFFRFYALEFEWWRTTIDIRSSDRTRKTRPEKDVFLSIRDPFEDGRDLAGNYTSEMEYELSVELRLAYLSISSSPSSSPLGSTDPAANFVTTFSEKKQHLSQRLRAFETLAEKNL